MGTHQNVFLKKFNLTIFFTTRVARNRHSCEVKQQKVELPEKEILTCQIVPSKENVAHHVYDVRFQKITPCKKLAQFRRQSTAPEFV